MCFVYVFSEQPSYLPVVTMDVYCRHIDVFEDQNQYSVKGPVIRPLSNKIKTKFTQNELKFTGTINSKPQLGQVECVGNGIINNK